MALIHDGSPRSGRASGGRGTVADRLRRGSGRVVRAAVTPLVPADYLDLVAPLRAGADLRARVVAVRHETADAATLLLQPGRSWEGHVPGQYVRLGVDVDGVRQWRAYSLTHGPRADGLISVTVKAVPDGTVSPYLVHRTRPGTLLHLEQAAGAFVLPTDATKLLFVTAGSGITPVIGMLRNLFPVTDEGVVRPTRSADLDIVVLHVAPTEADSIFLADLRALDAAGAVRLLARHDDVHGVLDLEDLTTLVPDLAERTTLACGPAGLLDALDAHHGARDLDLLVEQFRVEPVAVGEGGTVTFAASGVTAENDGGSPLLVTGEDAGVMLPSGCRMGVCFSCVSPLRSGAVRDLRTGDVITAADGVDVQTCISAAAGDCVIDR
ncbi:ferredoxin reductase [Nocardioidaceae bacterium]|nr:ferredoxin reductase [Nocardioidaceae bacterium]